MKLAHAAPDSNAGPRSESGGLAVGRALALTFAIGFFFFDVRPVIGGGVFVPAPLAAASGMLLLLWNAPFLTGAVIGWVCAFLGIATVNVLFAPDSAFLAERLKSLILLAYSMIAGLGVVLELRRWPQRRIARWSGVFAVILLTGTLLELTTPLSLMSDRVREAIYGDVYAAHTRDLLLWGTIRPKFFQTEPSHIGYLISLSAIIFHISSRRPHAWLWAFAILTIGLLMVRSSGMAASYVVVALVELWRLRAKARGSLTLLFAAGVLFAATVGSSFLFASVMRSRIEALKEGGDTSTLIRIVGPAYITYRLLSKYPFRGVGLGGEGAAALEVRAAFSEVGVTVTHLRDDLQRNLVNAFFQFWMFMGLGWGSLAAFVAVRLAKSIGVTHVLLLTGIAIILGNVQGAFVTLRYWGTLALIAGALAAARAGTLSSPSLGSGFGTPSRV